MRMFAEYLVMNATTLVYCKYISGGWYVLSCQILLPQFHNTKIEEGSARQLVKKFDVKKREYFGNTSMEAEISLLMANQTLVRSFRFFESLGLAYALLKASPGKL